MLLHPLCSPTTPCSDAPAVPPPTALSGKGCVTRKEKESRQGLPFNYSTAPVPPCLNCQYVIKTAGPVSRSSPGFIVFNTLSKAWPELAINYLLMRQHGLPNPHASGPGSSGSPSIPHPLPGPSRPRGIPRFDSCVRDFFIFFPLTIQRTH